MSYVVKIWDAASGLALPESVDAASRLLGELETGPAPGGNPKFVQLARQLTQRFPTPDMLPGDEGEPDFAEIAWSDWPIDGKTEAAVWNLGLNVGMLDEARPFLMQTAGALGLGVLDEQAGEAHLPGGAVLCLPGRTPVTHEDSADDPPRAREVSARIFEFLKPLLVARGFKGRKSSLTFRRSFAEGWHELYIWSPADRWPLCAEVTVTVTARLHGITTLRVGACYPDRALEDFSHSPTLIMHPSDWIEGEAPFFSKLNKHYQVYRPAEIETVLQHLGENLLARILPALDACWTLADFDRELNPDAGVGSLFSGNIGDRLIAAYLNANPRLDDLCREHDPRLHGRWEPLVESCVDYVRNHGPIIS